MNPMHPPVRSITSCAASARSRCAGQDGVLSVPGPPAWVRYAKLGHEGRRRASDAKWICAVSPSAGMRSHCAVLWLPRTS